MPRSGDITACRSWKTLIKLGLELILEELSSNLDPGWKAAFQVANKNMPRITHEVIEHAEALIAECVGQEQEGGSKTPPPPDQSSQTTFFFFFFYNKLKQWTKQDNHNHNRSCTHKPV